MCERLTQPVKQFRESLVGNNSEHLQPGFGLWAKFSYSHPDEKVKFFVIPSPTFTDGKIFESLKCIYYSPCAMDVLTVFMWNVSIIPKRWGFYWWLERNRLHCPELKSNEWHKVKINWRHLKKGKKKKTQRNLSFFFFSPHLQPTNLPTHSDHLLAARCLWWRQLIHVFICISPGASSGMQNGASCSGSQHSTGKSGGLSETAVH